METRRGPVAIFVVFPAKQISFLRAAYTKELYHILSKEKDINNNHECKRHLADRGPCGNPEAKYYGNFCQRGALAALDLQGAKWEDQRQQNQISRPVGPGRGDGQQGGAAETPDLHEPLRRFHRPAGGFFKIPADHVINVPCDDISPRLPASWCIRPSGSAGKHNGLEEHRSPGWAEANFPRIRDRRGQKSHPTMTCRLGAGQVPAGGFAMADRYPGLGGSGQAHHGR